MDILEHEFSSFDHMFGLSVIVTLFILLLFVKGNELSLFIDICKYLFIVEDLELTMPRSASILQRYRLSLLIPLLADERWILAHRL